MNLSIKQLKRAPEKAFPFAGETELAPNEHEGAVMALETHVAFRGEAVYRAERVYLTLKIKAEVERECSRCLDRFAEAIERDERITLREEQEVGLADDDFTYPDEAEEVSLLPYLQSLVFDSLDPKPLCRPDCRGLCSSCGVNLNREKHRPACPALQRQEARRKVDPRLARLSELL
jgi:uncharacterized protein